jgi:crotonobetainyl-CoA:carnitine CoA-transferase CaiB-like acyl-CoA transferase
MAQARSGLMSVTGRPDHKVGVAVADVVSGLYAAVGAVAGLAGPAARPDAAAGRGGPAGGGGVDARQPGVERPGRRDRPRPSGNDHPNIAPYGPVPCADTELVVGAGNDAQFSALCRAVGVERASSGRPTRPGCRPARAARGAVDGAAGAAPPASGCRCSPTPACRAHPVQDLAAVQDDPQVVATGLLQEVDHPAGPVRVVGSPLLLDGSRPRVRRAPPLLGQHTAEVLSALGLDDDTVTEVLHAHRR